MKKIDLVGQKYGELTVLSLDRREAGINFWQCQCSCGIRKLVRGYNLRTGTTKSCGCHKRRVTAARNKATPNCGDANGRLTKTKRRLGSDWIHSKERWFKRAAGRFHISKVRGIEMGFNSPQALAVYCRDIAPKKCPVFGFDLVDGDIMKAPSIDRIDPRKGYVAGNIQIISNKANLMKNDATPEELKQFAEWVLS